MHARDLGRRSAQPAARSPTSTGRTRSPVPSFHSARWDHSVDLAGQRVAMIGAGASGFQIAPTIAAEVGQLTVFQRTAQWMFPNPNYHEKVGPGVRWALRHLPFYGRWYRFLLFWPSCDTGLDAARVDPDYPDQQTAVSEINELTRQMFTDWIVSQVGDDPDLHRQGRARLPGDRQAHVAGQRQLAAHPHARQRRAGAHGDRPHRARRGRHRRRYALPGRRHRVRDRLPRQRGCCCPMEIVGRDGVEPARRSGASDRPPTSASPCPTSRTSSACTGRARTWRTAAA